MFALQFREALFDELTLQDIRLEAQPQRCETNRLLDYNRYCVCLNAMSNA